MKKTYYLIQQSNPDNYSIHFRPSIIKLKASTMEDAIDEAVGMPLDDCLEELAHFAKNEQEFEEIIHDEFSGELILNYDSDVKAFIMEVESIVDLETIIADSKEIFEKKKKEYKNKICKKKK